MPGHEDVEELAQCCEGLVLGERAAGEFIQKPGGQTGGDLVKLRALLLAPSDEPDHLVGVGGPGVGLES